MRVIAAILMVLMTRTITEALPIAEVCVGGGIGLVSATTPDLPDDMCERCDGQGKYPIRDTGRWQDPCDVCNGTGVTTKADNLLAIKWLTAKEAWKHSMAGKPVWVQLSTSACGPCIRVEREVFTDPRVILASRGFVCCKVVDNNIEWNIRENPTSILVTPGWKIGERIKTPLTVSELLRVLEDWRQY